MGATLEVHAGDVVSLMPAVQLDNGFLIDPIRSSALPVNQSAGELLALLRQPRQVRQLIEEFAVTVDIGTAVARRDVLATLDQLDALYLIDVRRDWRGRLTPRALRLRVMVLLTLEQGRPAAWSRRAGFREVTVAVLRGAGPFLLTAVALVPLLAIVLDSSGALAWLGTSALVFSLVPVLLLSLATVQFVAHEYAHCLVSEHFRASPYVVQRGSRIFVTHRGLGDAQRRLVAVAGPVVGAAVGLLQAAALWWFQLAEIAQVALSVGVLQLLSLVPWTADGRLLWRRPVADVLPSSTGFHAPRHPGG